MSIFETNQNNMLNETKPASNLESKTKITTKWWQFSNLFVFFFVNVICSPEQVCLPSSSFVTDPARPGPSGPLVKTGRRPAAWLTCNLVSRLQSRRLHQYSVTAPIVCRPRRALQTQLPPPLPPLSGPRSPPWKSIVSSWITKGCFSSTAPRVSTWTQLTTPCCWWYSVGGAGVFSRVEPAPSRWA